MTAKRPPFIPLHDPLLGGAEWRYVKECLDTGWVSSAGPFVERFESEFAAYTGSRRAVATVNGTAALHVALKAVGVAPGDEVLVPDLTFIAPVNAVAYCGAHPVLVDADPATFQMDAGAVEAFLAGECRLRGKACVDRRTGRRVRAVVPVHLLGLACDIGRIAESARRRGLKVVEDCAEAAGVRVRGRHVGTFGDAGAFSFNGNKIITAGGGGMLVSRDAALARYARYLTTQAKDDPQEYIHNEVGYNYRLSNMQAAVGLAQLERLEDFIAAKRRVAQAYRRALAASPGLTPMPEPAGIRSNHWLYTVLLGPGTTRARRRKVVAGMNALGVGVRPLWHPMHGLAPFRGARTCGVRNATRLYERAVSLPSSAHLAPRDQARVVAALRECS